jgi:TusA-related sulfurtransferase
MSQPGNVEGLVPDHVFEGGDLDCGSGLILLIRENMAQVPRGGILEMRSRETSVRGDLPPWCRMVGHEYLGAIEGAGETRYFIRRGTAEPQDDQALAEDKRRAREFEWRVRVRSTGPLRSTAYCRNFSFDIGQAASFEEKDRYPSAVEYLLGALAGDLASGFAAELSRAGLSVDDIEIAVRGKLDNILAHLGLEAGDPSFSRIELKCFASTLDDEAQVRDAWARTLVRSPLLATLRKAVNVEAKLAII